MKVIGFAVAIFLSALAPARTRVEGWLWWTPPTRINLDDRRGYSESEILAMGFEKWGQVSYDAGHDGFANALVQDVDSSNIVYGICLAHRNDRLIAKRPAKERTIYRQLRADLFRFAMACIAVEDTLAGGGTYSVHWPKYISHSQEDLIYAMLIGKPGTEPKPETEVRYKALLHRYCTVHGSMQRTLGGDVSIPGLHRYAKLAAKYYERCLKGARQLGRRGRAHDFVHYWLVDYLDIREADREVLPPSLRPKGKSIFD